jgi:hypothetical protein
VDSDRDPNWAWTFPKNWTELGFESNAGTYEVTKNTLSMRNSISLSPSQYGKPTTLQFELKGSYLTLKQTLRPRVENLADGEVITVLKRSEDRRDFLDLAKK